jgi:hypothetical protein
LVGHFPPGELGEIDSNRVRTNPSAAEKREARLEPIDFDLPAGEAASLIDKHVSAAPRVTSPLEGCAIEAGG